MDIFHIWWYMFMNIYVCFYIFIHIHVWKTFYRKLFSWEIYHIIFDYLSTVYFWQIWANKAISEFLCVFLRVFSPGSHQIFARLFTPWCICRIFAFVVLGNLRFRVTLFAFSESLNFASLLFIGKLFSKKC